MRTMKLALGVLLCVLAAAGCRTSSLPSDGDGGVGDMAGGGGAGGGGGSSTCAVLCTMGFTCCNGACVNLANDIHNWQVRRHLQRAERLLRRAGVRAAAVLARVRRRHLVLRRAGPRPLARPDVHRPHRRRDLPPRLSALPLERPA